MIAYRIQDCENSRLKTVNLLNFCNGEHRNYCTIIIITSLHETRFAKRRNVQKLLQVLHRFLIFFLKLRIMNFCWWVCEEETFVPYYVQ